MVEDRTSTRSPGEQPESSLRWDEVRELCGTIIGEEKLAQLRDTANRAISGGDQVKKGSDITKMQWEIRIGAVVITTIDGQLGELNQEFPGERKKVDSAQNPSFRDQRERLLDVRRQVSHWQGVHRRTLAGHLDAQDRVLGQGRYARRGLLYSK